MGVELPAFTQATRERLDELLPPTATVGNPLDWTAMIWDETDRLAEIVATVGSDPGIDQLLLLFDQPRELPGPSAASWDERPGGAGVRCAAHRRWDDPRVDASRT